MYTGSPDPDVLIAMLVLGGLLGAIFPHFVAQQFFGEHHVVRWMAVPLLVVGLVLGFERYVLRGSLVSLLFG